MAAHTHCSKTSNELKMRWTNNTIWLVGGWGGWGRCLLSAEMPPSWPIYSWRSWLQPLSGRFVETSRPIRAVQWHVEFACLIGWQNKRKNHRTQAAPTKDTSFDVAYGLFVSECESSRVKNYGKVASVLHLPGWTSVLIPGVTLSQGQLNPRWPRLIYRQCSHPITDGQD